MEITQSSLRLWAELFADTKPFSLISQLDKFRVTRKIFNEINHRLISVEFGFSHRLSPLPEVFFRISGKTFSFLSCMFHQDQTKTEDVNKVAFIHQKLKTKKRAFNPNWKFMVARKFYLFLSLSMMLTSHKLLSEKAEEASERKITKLSYIYFLISYFCESGQQKKKRNEEWMRKLFDHKSFSPNRSFVMFYFCPR